MWEKLTRFFQGNEIGKMNEGTSYNLPGHKEIGERILEAANNGKYNILIPLNDNKLRSSAWRVEEYYLKYSSEYQNLNLLLKEKGYSHRIIEFDKDKCSTGLYLYISWKWPGEKVKRGNGILEAIDAKGISNVHVKTK